jgi:hypothetical protein
MSRTRLARRVVLGGHSASCMCIAATAAADPERSLLRDLTSARLQAEGLTQAAILHASIEALADFDSFDAVVGRFVLREFRTPIETLAYLRTLLSPGGVVMFLEKVHAVPVRVFPPLPELQEVIGWLDAARERALVQREISVRLPDMLRQAGLPEPTVRCESPVDHGTHRISGEYLVEQARGMAPILQEFGIANAHQLNADVLSTRLRAAFLREPGSVAILAPMLAAWSRVA